MTLEITIESKTPVITPVETEVKLEENFSEKQRAFAANVFKAYERSMTDGQRLSALSQVDVEQFEDEVSQQIEAYLENDEDYQEFFARFKKARLRGGGDSFVPEMNERRNKVRELILSSVNLPEDSRINGVFEASKNIEEMLKDIPKTHENLDLALKTLGIKTKLGEQPGEYEYTFPYNLMPEKINKRWANYVESVRIHMDEKDILKKSAADTLRHDAHNGIIMSVSPMLQLDQFGQTWEEKRELFAKMRNDEIIFDRSAGTPVLSKEELVAARQLTKHRYGH